MSGFEANGTMPKTGHVTDLRERWLVRADGALAHRLQDREISSHLCENRFRNQQIREDFPVALTEQRGVEHEARLRELTRMRQAERDAEIARELAEVSLREADAAALGLAPAELAELRRRLEQEERDARLARELSLCDRGRDALLADMRCAVEAQDGELARLLQEREYKKLQRAKEKARQRAQLKKQRRLAQQPLPPPPPPALCDAYSNPRDVIRESGLRLCKSVDSDLNYVEPFEKEQIQSKANALLSKEMSKQYYDREASTSGASVNALHVHNRSFEADGLCLPGSSGGSLQHRHPPPPPSTGKKPRFPDPVSIRPASHYPTDDVLPQDNGPVATVPHSLSENNNLYESTFPPEVELSPSRYDRDPSKRLSVISDITAEGLAKKKSKQADMQKKRRGCKIQ